MCSQVFVDIDDVNEPPVCVKSCKFQHAVLAYDIVPGQALPTHPVWQDGFSAHFATSQTGAVIFRLVSNAYDESHVWDIRGITSQFVVHTSVDGVHWRFGGRVPANTTVMHSPAGTPYMAVSLAQSEFLIDDVEVVAYGTCPMGSRHSIVNEGDTAVAFNGINACKDPDHNDEVQFYTILNSTWMKNLTGREITTLGLQLDALDYERTPTVELTIAAVDTLGNVGEAIGVVISVNDVNEAPTFLSDIMIWSVDEDALLQSVVGVRYYVSSGSF